MDENLNLDFLISCFCPVAPVSMNHKRAMFLGSSIKYTNVINDFKNKVTKQIFRNRQTDNKRRHEMTFMLTLIVCNLGFIILFLIQSFYTLASCFSISIFKSQGNH